jgi:hypothetical protein
MGEVVQLPLFKKEPRPRKVNVAIKSNWQMDEQDIAFALALGWSLPRIKREEDCFRDYWLGTGKKMADWHAVWRNWVRRDLNGARLKPEPSSIL